MKKEQVFFEDTQFVGSEVENVQELYKAFAAGMSFAAEDGHTYYPYYEEDYVNEDGEAETREVEMNEDELFELMKADLDKELKVYAGIYVDGSKYNVVPASSTILRSRFFVGQQVYFMWDNKMMKGAIKQLWLTEGKNELLSSDIIARDIIHEYTEMLHTSYNEPTFKYIEDKVERVRARFKDFVCVHIPKEGDRFLLASDVFETAEELFKHLCDEIK